jgi:hypothetical protein
MYRVDTRLRAYPSRRPSGVGLEVDLKGGRRGAAARCGAEEEEEEPRGVHAPDDAAPHSIFQPTTCAVAAFRTTPDGSPVNA